MKNITIAVDAMGGDYGPAVIVPAALRALKAHPTLHLTLVGDAAVLQSFLPLKSQQQHSRLTIYPASQSVTMDESPSLALRNKKDSSMRVAINLVKENKAEACVSAGNTGALMAIARFVLKTLPGIDRPAILSAIPSLVDSDMHDHKTVRMLDLGANVDSTAEHLLQFAVMGSVIASAVDAIPRPRVCLLNIGAEAIKGNELVKATALLLEQSQLNYAGFVEGNDIYKGHADVIVCDGFVGNVALKTAEGVATLIGKLMKAAFKRNAFGRLAGFIALPVLKSMAKKINPERYNGASLVGLQGIVIKSHGGASIQAFVHAIEEAMMQVEKNIPERIRANVEALLQPVTTNPTKDDNHL